jgi:hypothetical protein
MADINKLVYSMLTTSTGVNMLDSGGDDGRHWQRNATKTLADFEAEPTIEVDQWDRDNAADSTELNPTVSVFHYLTNALELDDICDEFNELPCDDWDGEIAYGISAAQEAWLVDHDMSVSATWNSYNGECNLGQTLQGANVHEAGHESEFEFPGYVLLQIHQGADVRGGYTDAKLFKISDNFEYFTTNPDIYGDIDGVEVTSSYNGYSLTDDDGNAVPVKPTSKINLTVSGL